MITSQLLKRMSFLVRIALLLILAGGLFAGVPAHAATTSVDLVSNAVDPTADNWVTYTAFLTCVDARPSGTITFFADQWQLSKVEIVDGVASIGLAFDAGDHEISAVYAGDSSCAGGRATVHEAVGTAVLPSITSSPNASSVGQLVTFDASLPSCGSGTAIFYDEGTPFTSTALSGSFAIVQTSALTAGTHHVYASLNACTTNTITQIVLGSGAGAVTWCDLSGDGRLNPACGDRVAVYCNAHDDMPNIDVWVIDNSGRGHQLTTILLSYLSQVPSGTYAKALDANGVVYAGIDANGSGYVALQGGPYNGTALGDWAKTFTCKAAS